MQVVGGERASPTAVFNISRQQLVLGTIGYSFARGKEWYESVYLLRRLLLVLLAALIENAFYQAMAMSVFCMIQVIGHVALRPFGSIKYNVMEGVSVSVLLLLSLLQVVTSVFELGYMNVEAIVQMQILLPVGLWQVWVVIVWSLILAVLVLIRFATIAAKAVRLGVSYCRSRRAAATAQKEKAVMSLLEEQNKMRRSAKLAIVSGLPLSTSAWVHRDSWGYGSGGSVTRPTSVSFGRARIGTLLAERRDHRRGASFVGFSSTSPSHPHTGGGDKERESRKTRARSSILRRSDVSTSSKKYGQVQNTALFEPLTPSTSCPPPSYLTSAQDGKGEGE